MLSAFAFTTAGSVRAQPDELEDGELTAKVTFIGFTQNEDKTSRLFVHFAGEPQGVSDRADGENVVYSFQGTDIGTRNNRYPLNLKHFDALLIRATMRQVGQDVELNLTLRSPAKPSSRVHRRGDGSLVLHIDFPAPRAPKS